MVRLALCSLGLGLLTTAARSSAPVDATVLVQRQARAHTREEEDNTQELWTLHGGLPDEANYAFEHYKVGDLVEGRAKDGRWLPCVVIGEGPNRLWNIHVSDEFPGYDLPNVPSQLLRRPLSEGMSDWVVDNSWLHHKGKGIKYRQSKSLHNQSAEIASWGSTVVGTDEGNGWLRVNSGYLPMEVNGVPVLLKKERETTPVKLPAEFLPPEPTPPPPTYEVAEWVKFKTKLGDWLPAQIRELTKQANTYHIVVRLDDGITVYPVSYVDASRLKKTKEAKHVPQPNESPMCQRDGCIMVRVKTEEGKDFLLNLSGKMKVEMLMQMACNKRKLDWSDCKDRSTWKLNGADLNGQAHVHEAGLTDSTVVDMDLAPVPETADTLNTTVNTTVTLKKTGAMPEPDSLARNAKKQEDVIDELFKGLI